jgi:tetratricopeptide (TPR) repeat protein
MVTYKEYLEKQLETHKKKFCEAEQNYHSVGDNRYYNSMGRYEMAVRAFETALEVENGNQQSIDAGNAKFKRHCVNLYCQCIEVSETEDPAEALEQILNVLRIYT